MIAEVARRLFETRKSYRLTLYSQCSSGRDWPSGSRDDFASIKARFAICTDVTHDTGSPMYNKKESGNLKCGLGPVVCYGPAVQNNVLKMIIETAQKKRIPFQRQAVSRSTGTIPIHLPTPQRALPRHLFHFHSNTCTPQWKQYTREDVENVIQLIYEVLLQTKPGHDFRYIGSKLF